MVFASFLVSCIVVALVNGQSDTHKYYYGESYCSRLPSTHTCCVGRNNDCSISFRGTRCYCDSYCTTGGSNKDCCPDYEAFCKGVTTTISPYILPSCPFGGANVQLEERVRLKDPCYTCICKQVSVGKVELQCEYICPKIGVEGCKFNGIDYPNGVCVSIGDPCYSCTCKKTWYNNKVTMNCAYVCKIPQTTTTPRPEIIYRCYHQNRYWQLYESVKRECTICSCKQKSLGVFEVECLDDPDCMHGCKYNSKTYPLGHQMRIGFQECTCKEVVGKTPKFCCSIGTPDVVK